jgi:hypothetical protein
MLKVPSGKAGNIGKLGEVKVGIEVTVDVFQYGFNSLPVITFV